MQSTSRPSCARRSHKCEPMKPAPPVTRTLPASSVRMAGVNAVNARVIGGRKIAELSTVERFSPADIEVLFAYLRDNFKSVPYADGKYQSSYVVDDAGEKVVDYVGRFETLAQDYEAIA